MPDDLIIGQIWFNIWDFLWSLEYTDCHTVYPDRHTVYFEI